MSFSRASREYATPGQVWVDRGLARAREAQRGGLDAVAAREAAAREAAVAASEERLRIKLEAELSRARVRRRK